jgi:hypothetical protein
LGGNEQYQQNRFNQQQATRAPVGDLRNSLISTTGRLARASQQMARLLSNAHGAVLTSDYQAIGIHLNAVHESVTQLKRELSGLPADAKVLRREVGVKLKQAKAGLSALQRSLKTKMSRK